MSDKIKAALYIRVARMDDKAVEQQKTQLRIFAQEQGYKDIAIYTDNGYGGLNFNRPAFMQMESDIQAGRINELIIRDISRISRDTILTSDWLEKIRCSGVEVKSLCKGEMEFPFDKIRTLLRRAHKERSRHES